MNAALRHRRPLLFALVLLSHGAALWALQHGLQRAPEDAVTPAEMLVEVMPMEAPPAPPAPQPKVVKPTAVAQPKPAQLAPPTPAPVPEVAPAPAAVAAAAPGPATPNTPTAVAAAPAAAAVAAAPAAPVVQPPSSDADYLHNPKPAYPSMSRRLGETGKVVVRTLIGADGVAQQAEVLRSSGFERLDRAAVETALKWRYVPGKRAGIPEAMWFNVPLVFVLD